MMIKYAIALAIENNLDIEYLRYAPRISETELLRARGGGTLRGVVIPRRFRVAHSLIRRRLLMPLEQLGIHRTLRLRRDEHAVLVAEGEDASRRIQGEHLIGRPHGRLFFPPRAGGRDRAWARTDNATYVQTTAQPFVSCNNAGMHSHIQPCAARSPSR